MVLAPGGTTALTAQGANVSVAGTLGVGGALTAGSGITVSSGNVNLTGVTPSYQIAGVSVLSATTLGAGVLSSSLTGVGTITTGTWQAAAVGTGYGGTGTSTQFTQGSIVFAGSSGIYSQDNGSLYYDDTNDLLGIGTSSPTGELTVNGAVTGKALSIFNYTGSDQNIVVASKSGTEEFAVGNTGKIAFTGGSGFLQTLQSDATHGDTYNLPDTGGSSVNICLSTGNCIGGGGGIGGSGANNYLSKFTPDGSHIGSSMLFDNGSAVSIGTINPIGVLDIVGGPAGQALSVFNYTGSDQNILVASSSGSEVFAVGNTGDINFTGGSGFLQTLTSTASGRKTYNFPDITTASADVCLSTGNCNGSGGSITGSGNNDELAYFTAGNNITSSTTLKWNNSLGLFGIGITNPTAALTVNGAYGGNAAAIINQLNSGDLLSASSSGITQFTVGNGGAIQFGGNSGFLQTLTSTASANKTYNLPGFSGSSADICLTTGNCAGIGGTIVGSGGVGQLAFFTGGSNVSSSNALNWNNAYGLLGIGSASPISALTVTGSYGQNAALAVNQLNSGDILTASSSGTTKFTVSNNGTVTSSGNVNLTGVTPSYQIAGVSVLSATTLGAGVLSSSLTGVGTITTGTWQAAAVGTGYGGTGQNFSATATGSLPYFVSSGTMGALGVGSAGQILTVSGGAPAWTNAGGTVNFWQLNNGALSPFNTTNDLLLGATSTSSARFAFTNTVGPGTPTASISGGLTGGLSLNSQGLITTTANQSLTLGALGTGNVVSGPGRDYRLNCPGGKCERGWHIGCRRSPHCGKWYYRLLGQRELNRSNSLLSDSRRLCSLGNHPGGWCAFLLINRGRDNYHGYLAGSGCRDRVWGDGTELLSHCYGESSLLLLSRDNGCLGYRRYRTDPDGIRGSACLDKRGRNR